MKTLTLMRHAKSDWNHPGLADHERPLNQRGVAAAGDMAERLAERWAIADRPDVLVSSVAVRAQTTASVVAQALDLSLQTEPRLYPFIAAEVAQVIAEQNDALKHIMLFGHNPGISYLAAQLGALSASEMPTAAVVSMQFEAESWRGLLSASCVDYYYDFPKRDLA